MITMSQIAKHLGLTRQTVSAVMNNRYLALRISEETAERVRKTASEFGYLRNHLALAIRNQQSNVIGCLISGLNSEWVSQTLSGMLRQTRLAGFLVKIEEVGGTQETLEALNRMMEHRVAALFVCSVNPDQDFFEPYNKTIKCYGVPVVVSVSDKTLRGHHVEGDDWQGCHLAVEHLWELGHRRIAFFGSTPNVNRTEGFKDAMKQLGGTVPDNFIIDARWSSLIAEEETKKLLTLSSSERPTAIFCASDMMAAGVIRQARRMGIQVPSQLSVIGFSNGSHCECTDPRLTSVDQDFDDVGIRCADWLQKAISDKTMYDLSRITRELLPEKLKIRDSTAIVPQ